MRPSPFITASLILTLGFIAFSDHSVQAATFYVGDANCSNSGEGTEIEPFCSIQDGINAAVSGDTVLVAAGTYYENITMKSGVVIQGEGQDVTTIDGGENASVVTAFYVYSAAKLDGFTITNGNSGLGGGIYNNNSSPTVTNCTFSGNSATSFGGGMHNEYSSPTVTNCTFSGNTAGDSGGGIYNYKSSPTVTNCTFSGNSASFIGGGIYNNNSSPTITNCTFSENSVASTHNQETYGGGGMHNEYSSPTVTSCTFSGNSTLYNGGGMANINSSPTVTNCTFSGNSASYYGGGIYNYKSSPTVTNCTFSGNNALGGGGMYNENSSSPTLTNSILWGNDPQGILNGVSSTASVTYSDIQGGYAGTGNINADPMFVDPTNGDLHLKPFSPCIDAGDNSAPNLPLTDIDGEDRKIDDPGVLDTGNGLAPIVDMGAHEYSGISKIGDINGDSQIDMSDAILGLKTSAGILPGSPVSRKADVNGDGKIGMEEVIYVLHMVSGLRE